MIELIMGILVLVAITILVIVAPFLGISPRFGPKYKAAFNQTGTVTWYSAMKEYGFIKPDPGMSFADMEEPVFVHRNNLKPPLEKLEAGQHVRYDVPGGWGKYGAIAENVEVIP